MIAKLERVQLRKVWLHEAYDFTQWLEQNIEVLNDAIGLDLVNAERERKTESAFSVDLVAEKASGGTVIIENQLERSDHDHLGKLITYLTAMQAETAVWIVSDPRPEHVAAVAWLNESTSASFYLLKLEAVRIAGSPPAPLLTLIVGPSDEVKSVGQAKRDLSIREQARRRWWSALLQHPGASHHKHISPGTSTSIGSGSGIQGVSYHYLSKRDRSGVEVYIDRGKARAEANSAIFDLLFAHKAKIEEAYGGSLKWERLDGWQACRIRAEDIAGGYSLPEDQWPDAHQRLTDAMNRLIGAAQPYLDQIDVTGLAPSDAVDTPEGD